MAIRHKYTHKIHTYIVNFSGNVVSLGYFENIWILEWKYTNPKQSHNETISLFFYTKKPKNNRMVCICGSM